MRVLTLLLAVVLSCAPPGGAQEIDVSKGQIDGRLAMIAIPVAGVERVTGGARYEAKLATDDCQAHLTPIDDLETEVTFPCGKWFQPVEGHYRIWLEKPGLISEGYGLLTWENEPFTGKGLAMAMGMEPAGRIALAPDVRLADGQNFRTVYLRADKHRVRRAFDRRVGAAAASRGVAVAAGPVIAGIFDRKTDDAIALARPADVKAGGTIHVAPAPPKKGTDVLVVLTRPTPATLGKHEVTLGLQVDGKTNKPDVVLAAAANLFAIWYGVEGAEATLLVDAPTAQLPPTSLKLRPGKVVTFRSKLSKRSNIGVSIGGPEDVLRDKRLALELRSDPENQLLQTIEAAPNKEFRFDGLLAGTYSVDLRVDDWELRQRVELRPDADEKVMFTLAPILVTGVVYHGREPAPGAEVGFDVGRSWVRTRTDEQGRYETIFWEPGEYMAEVKIRDVPPFWDAGFAIRHSQTLDFHVPNTRFVVQVRDATTGKAIAGANVIAASIFEDRRSGEGRVAQTTTTDATGRALLPPMRPGEMIIRARADGYFESDVTREMVRQPDAEGAFEISLRPVGDTIRVTLRNPDGSPAAAARLWAVRSSGGHEAPLWNGITDESGTVAVPRAVRSAFFLIRPQNAAVAVRQLETTDEVVWSLSPAVPLTLHAGRRTRIAIWIDDVRLSGTPLALLVGTVEATDDAGNWSAPALPPRPLRVLAWRRASPAAIQSGAYDAAATQLFYPWARLVELQPVD
jgi:hypothetical protein